LMIDEPSIARTFRAKAIRIDSRDVSSILYFHSSLCFGVVPLATRRTIYERVRRVNR
jgi:hypothetical protein